MHAYICIYEYTYIRARVRYPFVIAGCKPCRELCGKQKTGHATPLNTLCESPRISPPALAMYIRSFSYHSDNSNKNSERSGLSETYVTPFSHREISTESYSRNLGEKNSIGVF